MLPPGMPAQRLFPAIALAIAACAAQHYEARPLESRSLASAFTARRLEDPDLATFAHPAEGEGSLRWDFEALTRVALVQRPELDVARTRIDEARAAITTAGARPNPTLSIDPEVVTGADDPWILGWFLDIPLETAGKRGLRVRAAEEKLSAEEYGLPLAAWGIRVEVRRALDELEAARTVAGNVEERRALEERRLALQRARLEAGAIDVLELGRAEQSRAQVEVLASDARERSSRALSSLAVALGLPREALASARIDPSAAGVPAPPDVAGARDLALANRLDLRAALADYARTEAELELEIARQYPDVHLVPGYNYDQGDHKISLGVSLELPLFNRNEGPIAEAAARRAGSAARFEELQTSVLGAVESARVTYADALEREANRSRALELAEAEERRVERALGAGAVERLVLVEAGLARLARERERAEAHADVLQALLRLEDALQCPLVGKDVLAPYREPTP